MENLTHFERIDIMAKKTDAEKITEAAEAAPVEAAPTTTPQGFDFGDGWNVDEWERASAEIWRPDEGEFVLGTYNGSHEMDPALTDYDEPVNVHFVIEKETGNRVSFIGGKMCDKFIAESPIDIGTPVFIRYMGQGATRKGNKVNNYDIRFKA